MDELRKKENEYMTAQLEVHNLNLKLQTMKDSHSRTLGNLTKMAGVALHEILSFILVSAVQLAKSHWF